MEKDGGCSFKCADSKEWRTDYTCGTISDFMAAGESHEQIPAVPKGFVRVVRVLPPNSNAQSRSRRFPRSPIYIYCGDDTTVLDTRRWTPHSDRFAAQLESYSLAALHDAKGTSLEELVKQHPWLKLNQCDFSFIVPQAEPAPPPISTSTSSKRRAAMVQESSEHEAEAAADYRVGSSAFNALQCTQCRRWHNVPDDVKPKVRRRPT